MSSHRPTVSPPTNRLFYIQLSCLYNASDLGLNKCRRAATRPHPTGRKTMSSRRSGRLVTALLSAAGLTRGALAPAQAPRKTVELSLSPWVPPSHPMQKAHEERG